MNSILGGCRRIYHSIIVSVVIPMTVGTLMIHGVPKIMTAIVQSGTDGEVTQKVTKATYPILY